MKRLLPILLAWLLLLAGCTGGPGGPGTDLSASPTDSGPTATPTIPAGTIAPGVTDAGLANLSALLEAHRTALLHRGFVLRMNRSIEVEGRERRWSQRLQAAANLTAIRGRAVGDGDGPVQQRWANASMTRLLIRLSDGSRTRYHSPPLGPVGSAARSARAGQFLAVHQLEGLLVNLSNSGVAVDQVDGETRYHLVANASGSVGEYRQRTVQLTVSEAGVIRSLSAVGTLAGNQSVTYDYAVVGLGVEDVTPPAWVAGAPRPVDASPTAGFENCTSPYLTLENPGPDAVPPESVVNVTLNGSTHSVTLASALEPGTRIALYLDADGTLRTAGNDAVPPGRTAMPNEASVTVRTGTGLVLSNGGLGFGCSTGGEHSGSATDGSG